MPNLQQLFSLKQQFGQLTGDEKKVIQYIENQQARDTIEKGFYTGPLDQAISFLTEGLMASTPELIQYFERGKSTGVALLFIDITGFSKLIKEWSNDDIKAYLDRYYRKIIPIVYQYGGQIEKLMGDGVIAVFGKPFIDKRSPEYVYDAEACAEKAIKTFFDTDQEVKVAIHQGPITYYKVPGDQYTEYTMIGSAITDLYRLESVSKPNAINFYKDSLYDRLGWTNSLFSSDTVLFGEAPISDLQGVDFTGLKWMKFPKYS